MDTIFPPFPDRLPIESEPGRFNELHLYSGARCNRTCTFCCVSGSPSGGYTPWTGEILMQALSLVARRGSLKFYGGEPTLDAENQEWAIRFLRQQGFAGPIALFSNGIKANALIRLLACDADTVAVLNYSIVTGRGEKPLPRVSLQTLQKWATENPERLFLSHDFVIPVGRQSEGMAYAKGEAPNKCFRCWPTLTSDGFIHACPFAVEERQPHYDLGTTSEALTHFRSFLHWVDQVLEPEAARLGRNVCSVCVSPRSQRRNALPMAR